MISRLTVVWRNTWLQLEINWSDELKQWIKPARENIKQIDNMMRARVCVRAWFVPCLADCNCWDLAHLVSVHFSLSVPEYFSFLTLLLDDRVELTVYDTAQQGLKHYAICRSDYTSNCQGIYKTRCARCQQLLCNTNHTQLHAYPYRIRFSLLTSTEQRNR